MLALNEGRPVNNILPTQADLHIFKVGPFQQYLCFSQGIVLLSSRVAETYQFNADPDPAFHSNTVAYLDPAHHQRDGNLQRRVHRRSRA